MSLESTSTAPSSAPQASILLLSQGNSSHPSTFSLKLAYYIVKSYSPIYVAQAYSTPPYSSVPLHLHLISNLNNLSLVGKNTKPNGIGLQAIVEYVGFLYDVCHTLHNATSTTNNTHKATTEPHSGGGHTLADDVDSFFIPLHDDNDSAEPQNFNFDDDLLLTGSTAHRYSLSVQHNPVAATANLLPDILLLRLDAFSLHEHTSGGMSSLCVCHGTHSRGMSLGDMGPLIRNYMDIIFICQKSPPPLPELHIKKFLGSNVKAQSVQSDILLAYVDQNKKLNTALLKKLEPQTTQSAPAHTPSHQPAPQQPSQATQPSSSSSTQGSSAQAPSSSTAQQQGTSVHRQLPWKGHIKYGNIHLSASVFCNKACPVNVNNWPDIIDLPGQVLRWSSFNEYMRQLFSTYSKTNICQWMCTVREEHQPTLTKLFQKLVDDDALYLVPLRGEASFFVFTPKGLFSKYLQNANPQKDITKPHFISIIIPKEEYEKIGVYHRKIMHQQQQQRFNQT